MIAAMAPRAILLDALGTLLALEPPAPRFVGLLAERHGIEVSAADAVRSLRIEMRYYREQCVRAADERTLETLRLECAAIVARELGGGALDVPLATLLPTLLDSLQFVAFPEVPATLERWRASGARLVVASNWDISLHTVLAQAGLRDLLDAVVTSAEVGASKPSGELFAAALASAGAQAWQAVHVGDSLFEDVDGAIAAGIAAVWLQRAGDSAALAAPPGVRVITTLDEL
jgi:putative hydrolase of the HAD superfamily